MGEGDFKYLVISFILITMFMVSALSFTTLIASDYGLNASDVSSPLLNFIAFNDTLIQSKTVADESQNTYTNQTGLDLIDKIIPVKPIFNIGKSIWNFLTLPFKIILTVIISIFTLPPSIVAGITAIFIISILFAFWRLKKTGS